jgi:DNA-binding NtrC family response regulator
MNILLIEDDSFVASSLTDFLGCDLDNNVTHVTTVKEAQELCAAHYYPVIITDVVLPDSSGFEFIRELKKDEDYITDIIVITGYASMDYAIEALRAGAFDFLAKPVNIVHLKEIMQRIATHQTCRREAQSVHHPTPEPHVQDASACELLEIKGIGLCGFFSPESRQAAQMALKIHGNRHLTTLITGETGTGKEIYARMIHYGNQPSCNAPFVALNCSAIPETLFESELFGYERGAFTGASNRGAVGKMELAEGGTLFLDEIGDMPKHLQPKLLKVLQDRAFYRIGGKRSIALDVRIICATNKDLLREVEAGNFREDLLYRINATQLSLQPLRNKKSEIPALINMIIAQESRTMGIQSKQMEPETMKILQAYHWPGNYRQLRNMIQRLLFLSPASRISPQDLSSFSEIITEPTAQSSCFSIAETTPIRLKELQKRYCQYVMQKHNHNKVKAASALSISYNRLRRILGEM